MKSMLVIAIALLGAARSRTNRLRLRARPDRRRARPRLRRHRFHRTRRRPTCRSRSKPRSPRTDRSDDDRRLDAGRKPGEVLAFFGIAPGQKIGELFAGGGYTSELIARVVGEPGHVWSENTQEAMDKFLRKPWTDRAAKPVMKNVTGVVLPVDAPFRPRPRTSTR